MRNLFKSSAQAVTVVAGILATSALLLWYTSIDEPAVAPGHSLRPLTAEEEKEVRRQAIEEVRAEKHLDSLEKAHDRFARER